MKSKFAIFIIAGVIVVAAFFLRKGLISPQEAEIKSENDNRSFIHGTVIDQYGKPLPMASVIATKVSESDSVIFGAATGWEGDYYIFVSEEGLFSLKSEHISEGRITKEITLSVTDTIEINFDYRHEESVPLY